MSETQPADPLLIEAKDLLAQALFKGDLDGIVEAIDSLVDAKLALAIEAMADRVEKGLGVRP